jgi:hypothetical protein
LLDRVAMAIGAALSVPIKNIGAYSARIGHSGLIATRV